MKIIARYLSDERVCALVANIVHSFNQHDCIWCGLLGLGALS